MKQIGLIGGLLPALLLVVGARAATGPTPRQFQELERAAYGYGIAAMAMVDCKLDASQTDADFKAATSKWILSDDQVKKINDIVQFAASRVHAATPDPNQAEKCQKFQTEKEDFCFPFTIC